MSRPRQISDEQILSAARECFLEHGPQAATSVIAERLGVSQAALFKRFGTKEALLMRALVPPGDPPWVSLCEVGPDERPLAQQLHEIGLVVRDFLARAVPCMAVLRAANLHPALDVMMEQPKPPPVRGTDALVGFARRAQRRGMLRADLDPRVFVSALLGAMQHHAFLTYVGAGHIEMPAPEEHVRAVVALLLRGAEGAMPT